MDDLIWCEKCQSKHTKEFGEQFHNLVLDPLRDHWAANVDKWAEQLAEAVEKESISAKGRP